MAAIQQDACVQCQLEGRPGQQREGIVEGAEGLFKFQILYSLHYCMDLQSGTENREQIIEIKDLLYPEYLPGCSEATFIAQFQPLFQTIRRFDSMRNTFGDPVIEEQIVLQIIALFNTLFSRCPRKELMVRVLAEIANCKGLLKNLAVGRQAISISRWQQRLGLENPMVKIFGVTQPSLRQLTDVLYQKNGRIPNLELLLSSFGHLLEAKERFEEAITSHESRVPPEHHHYLAILASAAYGCRYIWNRAVHAFIKCGGNTQWLAKGVTAAPAILREMSIYSGLMAYNLRGMLLTNLSRGVQNIDRRYKLQALLILSYYQCLSCLALTTGLCAQQQNYQQLYLPKSNLEATSYKSFQTVRKCEHLQAEQEQRAAEELYQLFTCEVQEQATLLKKFKSAISISDKKAVSCELIRKIQSVKALQEEELQQQLLNLKCIQQLKRTFSKFVDFQPLLQAFKAPKPLSEQQIVLASFEIQGLKFLQLQVGSKVRGAVDRLINQLKVIGDEQGRRIEHYYQFYNGYIHEYISYTKLLQQISTAERGYLKLITKSPFLFSEQTFEHMREELGQRNIDAMDFAMEAVAGKLELAVTFITLLVDRGYEQLE